MNDYTNYEELIRDTDEMLRDIMRRNEITMFLVCAFLIALLLLVVWVAWEDHRERKKQLEQQREWMETQIALGVETQEADGNVFYRLH